MQTSPQPRARQTADAIALGAGLSSEIACNLNELDMGEWTGRSFAELERDPRWRAWNERRASSRPPGGESMAAIRRRMLGHLHLAQLVVPQALGPQGVEAQGPGGEDD